MKRTITNIIKKALVFLVTFAFSAQASTYECLNALEPDERAANEVMDEDETATVSGEEEVVNKLASTSEDIESQLDEGVDDEYVEDAKSKVLGWELPAIVLLMVIGLWLKINNFFNDQDKDVEPNKLSDTDQDTGSEDEELSDMPKNLFHHTP